MAVLARGGGGLLLSEAMRSKLHSWRWHMDSPSHQILGPRRAVESPTRRGLSQSCSPKAARPLRLQVHPPSPSISSTASYNSTDSASPAKVMYVMEFSLKRRNISRNCAG